MKKKKNAYNQSNYVRGLISKIFATATALSSVG
jgi:hypothetical protein